jgi:fatty acid desaturase
LEDRRLNTTAQSVSRGLFRDREGALANTSVMAWVTLGWLASFALMGAHMPALNVLGVVLCTHTMVLAAYLIHEAAHQTLFNEQWANTAAGEWMNFIAGSSYASFERIRHMHIRHHVDRCDLTCFDYMGLMQRRPAIRRTLEILEWCYVPAAEMLMHLQIICRPFFVRSQRRHLPRVLTMLVVRGGLLALLGLWSVKALLLYFLAAVLLLHVLNFFDAFHHTFEQFFVEADQPVPARDRDRSYEQDHTYSNLVSTKYPRLNLLILNFCFHNAHHQRASVPWYRLPDYHRSLYADAGTGVMPLFDLLRTWHRNRVRRVGCDEYGAPAQRVERADQFVGAHGVSFLTVV